MSWNERIHGHAVITSAAVLLLAGAASALAQEEPTTGDAAALTGSEWQVVSTGFPASQEIVLRFEPNGLLSGRTACFDLEGTFSIEGDVLVIDAARDMLSGRECSTSEFGTADAFVGFLEAADSWTIDGDGQLVIGLGGDYPFDVVLEPGAPVDPGADDGAAGSVVGAWRLDTMIAPDGQEAQLPEGAEITLDLADDGTLAGFGGCTEYTGAYTVSGDGEARVADVEAAEGTCEALMQEVQEGYLSLLGVVDEAAIEDGSLVLETGVLGIDIIFAPAEGAAS